MPPAPAPCLHGLPPGECLICRTLGSSGGAGARDVAEYRPPASFAGGGGDRPRPVTPDLRPGAPEVPGRRPGLAHVVAVLVVIAVLGVAAWLLVGAVYAALHVVELIAVAAAAGWVGYRVGLYRGRRRG